MSIGAKTDHLTAGSTSGEVCSKDAEEEAVRQPTGLAVFSPALGSAGLVRLAEHQALLPAALVGHYACCRIFVKT